MSENIYRKIIIVSKSFEYATWSWCGSSERNIYLSKIQQKIRAIAHHLAILYFTWKSRIENISGLINGKMNAFGLLFFGFSFFFNQINKQFIRDVRKCYKKFITVNIWKEFELISNSYLLIFPLFNAYSKHQVPHMLHYVMWHNLKKLNRKSRILELTHRIKCESHFFRITSGRLSGLCPIWWKS